MSLLFQPLETRKKRSLDVSRLLIGDADSTFFVRIKGHDLERHGIYESDILVVDRSRIENAHKWYVVIEEGEFCLASRDKVLGGTCEMWGAVTFIIHKT